MIAAIRSMLRATTPSAWTATVECGADGSSGTGAARSSSSGSTFHARAETPRRGAPLDLGVTLDRRPPPWPSYGVRHSRSVLLVILLVLLLGLVPVAYASPPDPTWIGGYWDDDDFDNAVVSIVSACAITIPPVPDAAPQWARLAGIELGEPAFIIASPRPVASPRAPPLA